MKKTICVAALLAGYCGLFAQNSRISGVLSAATSPRDISLYAVKDGRMELLATDTADAVGHFDFRFQPDAEGFYVIGNADFKRTQFPVYLKKGDETTVVIDQKHIEFTGTQTAENKVLAEWTSLSENLKNMGIYFFGSGSTYREYFPELNIVAPKAAAFRKNINTKNKKFNQLMQHMVDYNLDFYSISLLRSPRTAHPTKAELPDYYRNVVVPNKFPTDDIFQTPYGLRYLGLYADYAADTAQRVEKRLAALSTDRQKGEFLVYTNEGRITTMEHYEKLMNQYGRYFQTDNLKARLENIRKKVAATKVGGKALNWSYPDINGKKVSLSDFAGKVVLIDIWATWCGPCKQEIPALKKMEEEMHGKDVVFVSISVDEAKDKAKWESFVKQVDMKGVQLFASGWSEITRHYNVKGIPRFMVVDKKGNMVSADAPRPSEPELRQLLEAELKK